MQYSNNEKMVPNRKNDRALGLKHKQRRSWRGYTRPRRSRNKIIRVTNVDRRRIDRLTVEIGFDEHLIERAEVAAECKQLEAEQSNIFRDRVLFDLDYDDLDFDEISYFDLPADNHYSMRLMEELSFFE